MAPIAVNGVIPDGTLAYFDENDEMKQVSVHSLVAGKRTTHPHQDRATTPQYHIYRDTTFVGLVKETVTDQATTSFAISPEPPLSSAISPEPPLSSAISPENTAWNHHIHFKWWEKHLPVPPSPPAPSPPSDFAPSPSPDSFDSLFSDQVIRFKFGDDDMVSGGYDGIKLESNSIPAPWFIYAFMGLGVILCCISCIGHIAAEAIHGCCLCFYTILKIVLILLELSLVAFIALDHRWAKDLPEPNWTT
nr:tetraspanin-18-like isoform X1 [Tanacetum cinerariifolium]